MIQLGSRTKIYVGIDPVDFRAGFKGLSAMVKKVIGHDPLSGHVFVFRNRRGDGIKMICFDGHACWTFHVKFAEGKLNWWPSDGQIQAAQLMGLLSKSSEVISAAPFREIA
jgi:transposase